MDSTNLSPPTTQRPAITTRAGLIDALRLAIELEHNLMCQYLFAAYSVKKFQHELEPAKLERARRWESLITLIARQEMEHLGLALNLLTAIGGTPSFSRPNFPQPLDYYGAANIKSTLTRCNLSTILRFQRFEAPDKLLEPEQEDHAAPPQSPANERDNHELLEIDKPATTSEDVSLGLGPKDEVLPPIDPARALEWCRHEPRVPASAVQALVEGSSKQSGSSQGPVLGFAPHELSIGSVQSLYQEIVKGFRHVSAHLGERELFIGKKTWQIFGGPKSPQYGSMSDLNQYGLDVVAVTDLKSAARAVRMILEQGEGIKAPPSYLPHTHFCMFTRIVEEMKRTGMEEEAARPVVKNPMTRLLPDVSLTDEVNLITNEDTLLVAKLFNHCYEVMLLLLLYLYSDAVKTEKETAALMDAAFFPFMTMFVRPLAELLTEMPAFKKTDSKEGNAGPGFELSGDVLNFPHFDRTWTLFQERIDALCEEFDEVIKTDRWIHLPNQEVLEKKRTAQEKDNTTPEKKHSRIFERLVYLNKNMHRLAEDWRADWLNIGREQDV